MIGKPVVLVEVKNVLATSAGSAIFLGNDEKVFVIYVDHSVGSAINMFLHDVWESVEDMSIVLKKMQDANNEADEGFPGM